MSAQAARVVWLGPDHYARASEHVRCAALALGDSACRPDAALSALAEYSHDAGARLVLFCGPEAGFHQDRFIELNAEAGREFTGRTRRQQQFDDIDFQLAAEQFVEAASGRGAATDAVALALLDSDDSIEARLMAAITIEAAAWARP